MRDRRWEMQHGRRETTDPRRAIEDGEVAVWVRNGDGDGAVRCDATRRATRARHPIVVQANQPLSRGETEEVARLEAPASQIAI